MKGPGASRAFFLRWSLSASAMQTLTRVVGRGRVVGRWRGFIGQGCSMRRVRLARMKNLSHRGNALSRTDTALNRGLTAASSKARRAVDHHARERARQPRYALGRPQQVEQQQQYHGQRGCCGRSARVRSGHRRGPLKGGSVTRLGGMAATDHLEGNHEQDHAAGDLKGAVPRTEGKRGHRIPPGRP